MAVGRRDILRIGLALAALAGSGLVQPASAQDIIADLIEKLTGDGSKDVAAYKEARAKFEAEVAAYWDAVTAKRAERRKKLRAGGVATPDDYVLVFPPEYRGPKLTPEIAAQLAKEEEGKPKPPPPEPLPVVADFLAHAKAIYDFEPERVPEVDFKRRYAREALTLGLTRDQVVRVYAFETGGFGTADMQSGINPITRQGKAISTALGYAQLLAANSIDETVKHGEEFIQRLGRLAAAPGTPAARATALRKKQVALRKMLAKARSVPAEWAAHVRYGNTPEGLGIHALNLDSDIGPWLQAIKLANIRKFATGEGRPVLTPAELEIMNLAGPASGLEMMTVTGGSMPTPNFFSRGGYERNSVVRGRTGAELLVEIDKRMDSGMRQPGAIEFARVFDEVLRERAN